MGMRGSARYCFSRRPERAPVSLARGTGTTMPTWMSSYGYNHIHERPGSGESPVSSGPASASKIPNMRHR